MKLRGRRLHRRAGGFTKSIAGLILVGSVAAAQPVSAADADAGNDDRPGRSEAVTASARFVSGRSYVVTARLGATTIRGSATMPDFYRKRNLRAHTPMNTLGDGRVEVLVSYGRDTFFGGFGRGYMLFTRFDGRLRPIRFSNGYELTQFSEGGYSTGFYCRDQSLYSWTYEFRDNGRPPRIFVTRFRLEGARYIRGRTTIQSTLPRARPGSCY